MYHNELDSAGAEHLARMTKLLTLCIIDNQIGFAGEEYLARLTNLTMLDIGCNGFGAVDEERVQSALTKTRIFR
jgi:hypothetical protein